MFLIFWGCQKQDLENGVGTKPTFTVEQARTHFVETVVQTKSGAYLTGERPPVYRLSPGAFTPNWENTHNERSSRRLEGVDAGIYPEYRYLAFFPLDTVNNWWRTVPISQRLVVNRWQHHSEYDGVYAYIASVIPTPE